jgi:hypothetical protein
MIHGVRGLRKSDCSVSSGCPLKMAASACGNCVDNAPERFVFHGGKSREVRNYG